MRAAIFLATVLLVGCPRADGPRAADDRALRVRVAQDEAHRKDGVADLVALAQGGDPHARELALRGLGRIGGPLAMLAKEPAALAIATALDELPPPDQAQFAPCAATNATCGIELGRLGRRKVAFTAATRAAGATATASVDPAIRYAAVYALQREHEPPADDAVTAALVARVRDDDPETRAAAIAALAKRKSGSDAIAPALVDRDWRVAVEAARALAGSDTGRVVAALATRSQEGSDAQVIVEGLRALVGKPLDRTATDAIQHLRVATQNPIARGWIACLALVVAPTPQVVDAIAHCPLPDHLRLPLLGELVNGKLGDAATRRAALRILLAHADPRVRAAGIGALAATWQDGDDPQTIVGTVASALAAKNPIIAGSAIDAAPAIYEALGKDNPLAGALDAALVARATAETDLELSAALYELIGKRKLAAGAEACRAGLAGHPVRAKAAGECLRALGQGVASPPLGPAQPPPLDVTTVIGKRLRWHLATTRGEIVIELRPDVAPWAVATIVELTRRGFYDGIEFHRVVPNFVVQGGDPTMSGWGGPGFTLPAEPSSNGDGFAAGGVGLADAGRDSAGSQWFIMHSRAAHLDRRYTWIGRVTSGQSAADSLLIGDKVVRATIEHL